MHHLAEQAVVDHVRLSRGRWRAHAAGGEFAVLEQALQLERFHRDSLRRKLYEPLPERLPQRPQPSVAAPGAGAGGGRACIGAQAAVWMGTTLKTVRRPPPFPLPLRISLPYCC